MLFLLLCVLWKEGAECCNYKACIHSPYIYMKNLLLLEMLLTITIGFSGQKNKAARPVLLMMDEIVIGLNTVAHVTPHPTYNDFKLEWIQQQTLNY